MFGKEIIYHSFFNILGKDKIKLYLEGDKEFSKFEAFYKKEMPK